MRVLVFLQKVYFKQYLAWKHGGASFPPPNKTAVLNNIESEAQSF